MTERRRTRNRTTTDPNAAAIGPRRPGGTYHSNLGSYTYEVLELDRTLPGAAYGWLIKIRILDGDQAGETRLHSTAWDPDRDRVITEPSGGDR